MSNMRTLSLAIGIAATLPLLSATNAQAASLDLTGGTTAAACTAATGTVVNFGGTTYCLFAGALWTTTDSQSTGTGVIDSFVRLSDNADAVSGMNTDVRPLPQDENSSPVFTHDILEGTVPIVTIAGVQYYEFLLDINQTNEDPFITLKDLDVCWSPNGDQTILAASTNCAVAGTNTNVNFYSGLNGVNEVQLDYSDNSGSGSGDLFVYIPVPAGGIADGNYIYLYSQFGPTPNNNNDGFEEWAVRTATPTNVPDSGSTLSLLGLAMLGAGYLRRRLA
jgi:hypothetical protein